MNKISVAMISLNEADRIGRTLESVKRLADEIILIDTNSIDDTVFIAQSYSAIVYNEKWKGFIEQKNSLTEKCTKDWILYLDCDEVLTESLVDEIKDIMLNPKADGYYINRRTHYLGKTLKHSWQPDKRLRLVKRSANPIWQGEYVHEELKIEGKVAYLKSEMLHYSYRDIADHFTKTIRYAKLSAESYYAKGKKPTVRNLLLNPFGSFFKMYLFKLGFLDGFVGIVAATSAYTYTFLKYAFLWSLNKKI